MSLLIQPWELGEIAIHKLNQLARKIKDKDPRKIVRIAVLSDAATQHYTQALIAILKLRGWHPEIYEAEYDTFNQEILNPSSGLYKHKPEFVIFFNCVQAAASRFLAAKNKEQFSENYLSELSKLWGQLTTFLPVQIIQHTLAMPLDRPLGNQSTAQADTFYSAVGNINSTLRIYAVDRKVRLIDTEFQASYFGKRQWFDERLWCQAKQALSPSYLPALAKTVSDVILTDLGVTIKCVVVDLDNTMWGGILADDGPNLIEIGQTDIGLVFTRFQYFLVELKKRGVLLAICSKNNHESVISVLDTHPDMILHKEDFAVIIANYEDKASNIKKFEKS